MRGLGIAKAAVGICIALATGSAWAENSSLLGRWHWNRTQSTMPSGEPVPNDLTIEISRVDSTHVKWSLNVLAAQGRKNVEAFNTPPTANSNRGATIHTPPSPLATGPLGRPST